MSAAPAPIPSDLPCALCNYNLKGLDPAANCPECGQPIARSFTPNLALSTTAHLRHLAATMFLLAPLALLSYWPNQFGSDWRLAGIFQLLLALETLYAGVRLTAPEFAAAVDRSDPWRRGLLVAAGFYAAALALGLLPLGMLDYRFRGLIALAGVGAFAALNWLVARQLHLLARRAADRPLVQHARLTLWVLPIQALLQVAVAFVFGRFGYDRSYLVASTVANWIVAAATLVYLLLLGRLHETCRAAAKAAERRQATSPPPPPDASTDAHG